MLRFGQSITKEVMSVDAQDTHIQNRVKSVWVDNGLRQAEALLVALQTKNVGFRWNGAGESEITNALIHHNNDPKAGHGPCNLQVDLHLAPPSRQ